MAETIAQMLTDPQKRRAVVIISTGLAVLLMLVPAVQDYLSARDRYADLKLQLEESQQVAQSAGRYEALVKERRGQVETLAARTVNPNEVEAFRSTLVQLVRQSECRLRQIRVGNPGQRPWYEQDDVIQGRSADQRGDETPFQLVSQRIEIQLSGSMDKVLDFLANLHALDKTLHTSKLQLRRLDGEENVVQLDMEFVAFDLTARATKPAP